MADGAGPSVAAAQGNLADEAAEEDMATEGSGAGDDHTSLVAEGWVPLGGGPFTASLMCNSRQPAAATLLSLFPSTLRQRR